MDIRVDDDVRGVVEFMQRHIPADRLCSVANAMPALARVLWGHFDGGQPVVPLRIKMPSIEAGERHKQSDANGSPLGPEYVDGGSAEGTGFPG